MTVYGGTTFDPTLDEDRLNDQTLRIYRLMNDSAWRTLGEIAAVTHDPEASVSARLRDLRKPSFGGFTVNRRRRGVASMGLWEYQLQPPGASPAAARKARKTGFLAGLKFAARVVLDAGDYPEARAALKRELLRASGRSPSTST